MVNDSTASSYRVYGLTPFDRYNISIAGRTRKGNGDRSQWFEVVQGRKGELSKLQLLSLSYRNHSIAEQINGLVST